MSNLTKARQAILAELRHAEKGAAYYQTRAEALRAALEQLEQSDNMPLSKAEKKTGAATKLSKGGKGAGGRKASSSRQGLPKTSQEFWLGFIGQQPKTAAEIANAAVASLDFAPTPLQSKQLKSRLAPTLQALLKAKKVQDTGSGRERKYKLGAAKAVKAAEAGKGKTKSKAASSVTEPALTNGNAVHH